MAKTSSAARTRFRRFREILWCFWSSRFSCSEMLSALHFSVNWYSW
jgi:hypothetical protein